ncbi:MAG: hypothetical protein P8183_16395 [Anaerolineae bacterium]|jgi:hypothetical protein
MVTFSALLNSKNLDLLPKVEKGQFKLLWHCDYWDGAKSGMLLYKDKKHWFQVFNENDDKDYYRRFAIVELSESQLAEEESWHELFREKVGTHTDYGESGKRAVGTLKPQELWSEFYNAYKNRSPQDFSNNQVVAWFEI